MNNQLSNAKGDHSSTTALSRHQRVPSSSANVHLKTESSAPNDELRSPQKAQPELRQTFRRPRMPYNKLPDAFNIKNKKKKTNKDHVDNLDKIVKINEYKEIQKLLHPISIENKPPEKPNSNPLATIHKYFKMESRFRSKMEDLDRSSFKSKALSTRHSGLRIAECITLQILKHRHNTGTLKKILYVPTLKLLTIKEEPLNHKDQRISLKTWLQVWQQHVNSIPQFLNLQGFMFNVPQGAISVVTDYCQNGSLVNLLDSVFMLPESVIKEIFQDVFRGISKFHQTVEEQFTHFGGLSPSQILFKGDGKVKIGMGLYHHLLGGHSDPSSSIYNIRNQVKHNLFDMNSTQKNFTKPAHTRQQQEKDRSLDVFKLGLMMLECAIGRLQNFEQSSLIEEAIKILFTEDGQALLEKQNVCCLIHSESFLLETIGQQDDRSRRDRVQLSKLSPYLKYLKDRFSMPFQSFLCSCLKLTNSQRPSLADLLNHSFLRSQTYKDSKTVHISLSDLLLINIDWSQDLLQSVQEDQCERMISHILHVLSDCRKEVINNLIHNQKDKIIGIGKYIGFHYPGIGDKLYEAILELSQPQRDFNTSI